jgi:hypothetical protein
MNGEWSGEMSKRDLPPNVKPLSIVGDAARRKESMREPSI